MPGSHPKRAGRRGAFLLPLLLAVGCSLVPDARHRERYHNPFPQLQRIAILPFYNQSNEPTLSQDEVAAAYYEALQTVPGFEVLPVGLTKNALRQYTLVRGEPQGSQDFQEFARFLGVDAVVVGAVSDYSGYYPPRMAMTVRWYAANPAFHPIPPGYGLPWGTEAENKIPSWIVLETELELARQQLATQTPQPPLAIQPPEIASGIAELPPTPLLPPPPPPAWDEESSLPPGVEAIEAGNAVEEIALSTAVPGQLPAHWPDPRGLIPPPPTAEAPPPRVQYEPILTHTRLYRGDDADFTQRLADHVYASDEARLGGWQGYLKRSDDFIRFCCHLHVREMLESRGGRGESDLILRWPVRRYWR